MFSTQDIIENFRNTGDNDVAQIAVDIGIGRQELLELVDKGIRDGLWTIEDNTYDPRFATLQFTYLSLGIRGVEDTPEWWDAFNEETYTDESKDTQIKKENRVVTSLYIHPKLEQLSNTSGVYVLQADNGLHKIGLSKNVEARVRGLMSSSPVALTVRYVLVTSQRAAIESRLHERFQDKRQHGEWFNLDPSDLLWIVETACHDKI